ncbi:MAG TPA: hypothetical protein VHG91_10115 [Longimicrobium sp.]|nr:hypothetical protein [Longimicrobium sp.]
MEILAGAAMVGLGWQAVRYLMLPTCPRCKQKKWDRKLCYPLLFCRRCATRCDMHGRTYN